MKRLEFLFDFASPNGYLAYRALPDVLARTGAELQITPVLLGGLFKLTGNQAPFVAFKDVKGKLAYEQLEVQRFIQRHGLTAFRMNPNFPLNTLTLMRGLVAAKRLGVEAAYVEAGLAGMWERGLKMDDPVVLGEVLTEAGLDAEALIAAAGEAEVKAELAASTEAAAARGAFGVPTFFVGADMYYGKERLGQIEAALGAA